MDRLAYTAIILIISGMVVAAVGSFWGASWNSITWNPGPYAWSIGIVDLVIFVAGTYLLIHVLDK
jgi:hypothetical protein